MRFSKNEDGMALVLVLIVMVVVALLGTALWQYSISELNSSVHDEKKARAYYTARAGAEAVAIDFMRNPNKLEELNLTLGVPIKTEEEDYKIDEKDVVGKISVEIERTALFTVKITGIGTVDGIEQRVAVLMEALEPFDGIMYSSTDITFGNSIINNNEVKGNIVTGGKVYKQNDELTEHPNAAAGDEIKTEVNLFFPDPVFPTPPASYTVNTLNVSGIETISADERPNPDGAGNLDPNVGYNKIDISSSGTLIIDARLGSVIVQTKEYHCHNQGAMELITSKGKDLILVVEKDMHYRNVKVTGDGLAKIYVKSGEVNAANTHADLIDEGAHLVLYLGEGVKMSIQTGNIFEGLIYGPKAIVEMHANNEFYGSIIADRISGNNSGNIGSRKTHENYGWEILDDIFGRYRMIKYIP